ncbi:MAG: elongation factor P [Candidatus Omnitrophota bacterium]
MTVSITQLKPGLSILINNEIYSVMEYQHVKPGKGGAFVRTRLKNLITGSVIDKTFKSDDKIQDAYIEQKKLRYIYHDGNLYHFMDQDTFEDSIISKEQMGNTIKFLKDNLDVTAFFYKDRLIRIELPTFINLKIKQTEPGVRGDTAKAATKPAELETGAVVQVPLFVDVGDVIKVDTRTESYVERKTR